MKRVTRNARAKSTERSIILQVLFLERGPVGTGNILADGFNDLGGTLLFGEFLEKRSRSTISEGSVL